jgi:hypothetical protein
MPWRRNPQLNKTITGKIEYNGTDSDIGSNWSNNQVASGLGYTFSIIRPRNASTVLSSNSLTGGANKPFFTVPAGEKYKVRLIGGNCVSAHDASANITNYASVELWIGSTLKSFLATHPIFVNATAYNSVPFLIPDGIDYWISATDTIYANMAPAGWSSAVPAGLQAFQASSYFHFEFSFQLIGYSEQ